jgi:hypothetical protein
MRKLATHLEPTAPKNRGRWEVSLRKWNEFGADTFCSALQNRDAARHSKTGFASVTRIEEKGRTNGFGKWFVSVAKDHHSRLLPIEPALKRFIERVRVHNVMNEKLAPIQFGDFSESVAESRIIGIPQNCSNGSNLFKFQDEPGLPDVATVKDVVNSGEEFRHFWIEEIVSIRNDADSEHGAWCVFRV